MRRQTPRQPRQRRSATTDAAPIASPEPQDAERDAQRDAARDAQGDAQADAHGDDHEEAQEHVQEQAQEQAQADARGDPHGNSQEHSHGDPHEDPHGEAEEGDQGDAQEETGPLRRCVATRERLPKERMIRFVVAPDRTLVPDLTATLPGRGMWLSATRDVLETGCNKGTLARAFARAARSPIQLPPDLPALLEAALVRRIGELLGLARRAGQAVAGFDKAREWLRGGRARLVLQASDGSEGECARFLSGSGRTILVLDPLPAAMLGRMFGRDQVVHVAVAPGRLAERLRVEAIRLAGLRGQTVRDDDSSDSRPRGRESDEQHRQATAEQSSGFQRVKHERKQRSGCGQGSALSAPVGTPGAGQDR